MLPGFCDARALVALPLASTLKKKPYFDKTSTGIKNKAFVAFLDLGKFSVHVQDSLSVGVVVLKKWNSYLEILLF